jgi:hypothetical protein
MSAIWLAVSLAAIQEETKTKSNNRMVPPAMLLEVRKLKSIKGL